MKKTTILTIIFLAFAVNVYAAGSCTVKRGLQTNYTAEIVWECTGDSADGSIPNTPASSVLSGLLQKFPYTLAVTIENLSTDTSVTDNSDVYLYDKSSGGADLFEGDGVDQLDDDTRNFVRLTPNPLPRNIWLGVSNQATASGEYTVTLVITR